MNGRVYDYGLGRFTGVDPFIQFPLNSQSLNPYSYILNNPLSGTDPTGYSTCSADQNPSDCAEGAGAGGTSKVYTQEAGSHIKSTIGTVKNNGDGSATFTNNAGQSRTIGGNGGSSSQGIAGSSNRTDRGSNQEKSAASTRSNQSLCQAAANFPPGEQIGHAPERDSLESDGTLREVPGYPEAGEFSYRGSLDTEIFMAVYEYNAEYNQWPGDYGYIDPSTVKAWVMVESGGEGNRDAFLSDPLQINNSGDWVAEKAARLGLAQNQDMTPAISLRAGLRWWRYKGSIYDGDGDQVSWRGDNEAFQRYNGNTRADRQLNGVLVRHQVWYADTIMRLREGMEE
jgi:hypothetical protein